MCCSYHGQWSVCAGPSMVGVGSMTAFVTVPERADLQQIQTTRPYALNKRLRNTGSAAGTDT